LEKRNLVLNSIKNKKNQQYLKYTVDSINLKLASTEVELIEIKKLQNQNLKGNLSPEKIFEEGFLTADYTLSYLKEINQKNKAIILKKKKSYWLCTSYYCRGRKKSYFIKQSIYSFQ